LIRKVLKKKSLKFFIFLFQNLLLSANWRVVPRVKYFASMDLLV
jgi:hypothetical protein